MTEEQRERRTGAPGALRIFISYRREDAPAHAGRLADRLVERFGQDDVFMDTDSIAPGLDFREVLKDAINACDVLVVAIGQDWLGAVDSDGHRRLEDPNDYVRLEIEAALERNVRVIPVLLDGGYMPSPNDLPGDIAPLFFRNAVEIGNKHFHSDVNDLISRLEKIEQETTGGERPSSIARTTAAATRSGVPVPEALRPRVGPTTSLTSDFRFHLPLYDAIVACTEAIDSLGWHIETVEFNRIVSYANTESTQRPPKIEVELSDSGGQTTNVKIIGTASGADPRQKDALIAELNRVRYAIEARIGNAKASAGGLPTQVRSKTRFDRKTLSFALAALLVGGAVTAAIVIASSGGGSTKTGGGAIMPAGQPDMSHLQGLVPDFGKWNCMEGRSSSPSVDEQAACTPRQGANSVKLTLYMSMGAADAAYMKQVEHASLISPTKIKPNTGRCTTQSWGGEVEWVHAPGVPGGRKLCYLTSGQVSHLVWTYNNVPLLVTADRTDEAHGLLDQWFNSVAHDIGAGGAMHTG